ncbi:MAG: J domain-containing protein, partial [Candidatus Limnocylindrales bacterium]
MAPDADPYRTLGLDRGASIDEVKRAYRRLAKVNHPDKAGETALPRFLAIQAAYDLIAGPDGPQGDGQAGGAGGPVGGAGGRRPGGARRPWDADADRANATHRAYGGRGRRPRPGGPRPSDDASTGGSGAGGGADNGGPRRSTGSTGSSGGFGPASGASGRHDR